MRCFRSRRVLLLSALLLVALIGTGAWVYREPLLCHYYLRELANAGKDERLAWIERLADLDAAATPGLLTQLESSNAQVCSNAGAALDLLAKKWGTGDAKTLQVAQHVAERFAQFSTHGQEASLRWQKTILAGALKPNKEIVTAGVALLKSAMQINHRGVRQQTLVLAKALVQASPSTSCVNACREVARKELRAPEASCRAQALALLLSRAFEKEKKLLKLAATLLKDDNARVRKTAILLVGLKRELVGDEEMLHLLHDRDQEIRRLCELALKRRGLSEDQIRLGKLITDPNPHERLKVLDHLPYVEDLDPVVWLLRLSEDRSDAVRAGAVRAMAAHQFVELRNRLQTMARFDPSPTIQQNAAFYLSEQE